MRDPSGFMRTLFISRPGLAVSRAHDTQVRGSDAPVGELLATRADCRLITMVDGLEFNKLAMLFTLIVIQWHLAHPMNRLQDLHCQ